MISGIGKGMALFDSTSSSLDVPFASSKTEFFCLFTVMLVRDFLEPGCWVLSCFSSELAGKSGEKDVRWSTLPDPCVRGFSVVTTSPIFDPIPEVVLLKEQACLELQPRSGPTTLQCLSPNYSHLDRSQFVLQVVYQLGTLPQCFLDLGYCDVYLLAHSRWPCSLFQEEA